MKAKFITFVRGLKNGTPPRFQSYLKSLLLLVAVVASVSVWGVDATIATKDLPTSYSTGDKTVDDITYYISNVANYGNGMQFKSTPGYIYNKTALPNISAIELTTQSGKTGSFKITVGSSQNPSANEQTVTNGNSYQNVPASCSYFKITSTGTAYIASIKITYGASSTPTTITYHVGSASGIVQSTVGSSLSTALKDVTTTSCDDYSTTFMGWSTASITGKVQTSPTSLLDADATVTEDMEVWAVWAKKTQGTQKNGSSTYTIKQSSAPSNPYVTTDANGYKSSWSKSGTFTFENGNGACMQNGSSLVVTLPDGAIAKSIGQTGSGNSWSTSKITLSLKAKGISNALTTWNDAGKSYNFTNANNDKQEYTLSCATSSSKKAYIASVTINYSITPIDYSDYLTTCAPTYAITTNNPANGSIKFSTDGTNWSSTIADQEEDANVYFKLVPNAGYELESVNLTSSIGDMSDYWKKVSGEDYYFLMMPAAAVTVSATFSCATPTFKTNLSTNPVFYTQNDLATALTVAANETWDIYYQWESSTDNSIWNEIKDADDESYTPSTTSTGTTYYRCVLTNLEGACLTATATSAVATVTVNAPTVCKTPTFSIVGGTYTGAQSVELACATDGASIYYTKDGNDPSSSSTLYTEPITIDRDMTLKAIAIKESLNNSQVVSETYTINYTVTFDANGHGTAPSAITNAKYNQTITAPTAPSVTGYDFGGWFKETTCDNEWIFASDVVTKNIILFAKWTPKTYNITYHLNDGEWNGDEGVATYTYGVGATLPTNVQRANYEFDGWFNNEGCTGSASTKITSDMHEDKEYWAKWTAIYPVTFVNNGTTLTGNEFTKNIRAGEQIGTLPTLTEESDACDPHSRTFVGWTSEEAWNGKVASFDKFVTSSTSVNAAMTLNAVWAESVVTPSTNYAKITSESNLTEGNYVIAYKYDNQSQFVLKNEKNGTYTTQMAGYVWEPTNDQYSNPDAAYIWKITPQNDGSYSIYNASVDKYVNATSATSGDGTVTLSATPSYFNLTYITNDSRWVVALKDGSDYCLHGYSSNPSYYFKVSTSPKTSNTKYKYRTHLYKQGTQQSTTNYLTTCSTDPLIEVSETELSGFSTIATTGNPSAAQSFTVEGYNLTEGITVSASTGYEVSSDNSNYSKSLSLTQTEGKVTKTTVYVRLAAATEANDNVTGDISLTSTGATGKTVALTGEVIAAVTVTFNNNGTTTDAPAAIKLGKGGTLGSNLPGVGTMTAPISGYTFVGWVNHNDVWTGFESTLTQTLITGNEPINDDVIYDAVWANMTNNFEIVREASGLTSGNYVINGYDDGDGTKEAMDNTFEGKAFPTEDHGVISTTDNSIIWNVTIKDNKYALRNLSTNTYFNFTSSSDLTLSSTPVYLTISGEVDEEVYKIDLNNGSRHLEYDYSKFDSWSSAFNYIYFYKQQISNFFVTTPDEYTVTWHKGNAGTATSSAFEGQTFADIVADAPSVDDEAAGDCANKFMGWATEAIEGTDADGSSVKWAKDNTTPISGKVDYYAVFAQAEGTVAQTAAITPTDISGWTSMAYATSYNKTSADGTTWSMQGVWTNGSNVDNLQMNKQSGRAITTPEFASNITKIEFNAKGTDITIYDASGNEIKSQSLGSTADDYVIDMSDVEYNQVKIANKTSGTTNIYSLTITYGSATYSNYVTQCTPVYDVNFYKDEAKSELHVTQKIKENEKPTAPTNPSKVGCNFLGWSETWKGTVVDVTTFTITAAKDFFAKWQYITPTITTHPQSNTGVKGANLADLTVVASADGATLSYQWQVSTTSSTEGFTNISGATSASYTPSTAEEGSFYYRCVVTNGEASATSNAATITVSPVTQCTTPTMIIGDGSTTYFIHSAMVTLATETEGASIYYTTDGTTASTTSTQYTTPFEISATTMVKAIAVKTNMTNSFEGTATFSKAALIGIEIKTAPTKVTYDALETFAPAGLVITANYESNLSEDVAYDDYESEFSFEPALDAQLHETNTTVQITWNGQSVNQTITVTRVLTSISDATTSATFYEGGQVKATDFTCTYNYNDGDPVTAQAVELVSLNGTDFATIVDIPLGQTGEKTITVKKGTFTTTVNITVNEKAKHTYIDRVHGNEDIVKTDGYTIPELSNTAAATEGDCATTHYVFKGWVTEADADVPTDANLIAAGGSKTAEADATFYAVWAEHKQITKDLTMFYGWETTGSTSGWKSAITAATTGYHSGSQSGKLSSSCTAIETTNKIAKPKSLTYYARKTSGNDKAAQYIVLQYSSSTNNFNNIDAGKVTNQTLQNDNAKWTEVKVDLTASTYQNQYFRIHKEGNAEQLIDDVTLIYEAEVEEDVDYITECVTRYELTFDANGGTGTAPEAILLKEGGKVNLPNATLTKAYNDFNGWNTKADGKGTSYSVGAEYTMGATDATLYAAWAPRAVTALKITSQATTKEFGVGQAFSAEGLTVKATYEGGETEENVAFTTNYDNHVFTEEDVELGKTVTITYKEGSTTYTIDVKAYPKAEFYVFGEHYDTYVCKEDVVALAFPAIPSSEHLVYKNFVGWSATEFGARKEEPTLVTEGAAFSDGDKFYAVFGRASEYEEKTTTITRDKCNTGESTGYDWYPWTADGISGEIDLYATTKANMQMKHKDGRLGIIFSNVATPGKILSISATKESSGTTRTWDAYVSATAFSESTDVTALTSLGAKDVNTTPVTWSVTDETARFFLLQFATGGGTNIDNFTVTYLSPVIYSWTTNWVEPDHVRTGLTYDNAGTICLPYAVKADDYKGASVWSIESRTGAGTMISSITLVQEVDNDGNKNDLVAGKPYIFFAEESEFQLFYSGDEYTDNESVWANGLIGNLDVNNIVINGGGYQPGLYLINQNKLMECGANCQVPQYRAYVEAEKIGAEPIQAPIMAPRRYIGNPNSTPTNMLNINGSNKATKILINDHIVILRENKMYNAQGLFVK